MPEALPENSRVSRQTKSFKNKTAHWQRSAGCDTKKNAEVPEPAQSPSAQAARCSPLYLFYICVILCQTVPAPPCCGPEKLF